MSDRAFFLAGYFGSAALAAFLAVCVSAPRVSTFTCDTPREGARQCELAATWASTPARGAQDDATSAEDAVREAVALGSP